MNTWYIHITGIVQGVGFRPFVYKLAREMGVNGWVKNDVDGVKVMITCSQRTANQFFHEIKTNPPSHAVIHSIEIKLKSIHEFQDFKIIHNTDGEKTTIYLTPDFATCEQCLIELTDPDNERYRYPFITCSDCGPRYSITRAIPFERAHTEMSKFMTCNRCQSEYDNPLNRRFYAQTTSCDACGVKMTLHKTRNEPIELDSLSVIKHVVSSWKEGKIIAIKGVGGYLITCDASNKKTIKTLRRRKKRPNKPLALMYPLSKVMADYALFENEREEFLGPVAPIVLLQKPPNETLAEGICDGLSRVGIMIPYAPSFQLLLSEFDRPIVATSGNVSNSPIIFQDKKALNDLFDIADLVLTNNRDIVVPQDDSVITYSSYFMQRTIMRRSRGMAPSFFRKSKMYGLKSALAMGAQLKSTFTILHHGNTYVSQYLGDLDNYETEQNYHQTLSHQINLLGFDPDMIIIDLHEAYSNSIEGIELASKCNLPLLKVQHHIAHFSALLGEHSLLEAKEKTLGIVWDGTGLGSDKNIWGGEFFTYYNHRFERVNHLPYFDHIAHDKMAKEPRLVALSLYGKIHNALPILQSKFTPEEWKVYTKILEKKNALKTSSVGRLFDGIASITGLIDVQSYEGQAASMMQVNAEKHFREYGIAYDESYFDVKMNSQFSLEGMLKEVISDVLREQDIGTISAKFHVTLVDWIKHIAIKEGVRRIGFSGGVFQNTLLVDLIIHHLQHQYELLFHQNLSPNDENISFGQLIYAEIQSKSAKE